MPKFNRALRSMITSGFLLTCAGPAMISHAQTRRHPTPAERARVVQVALDSETAFFSEEAVKSRSARCGEV